MVVVTLLMYYRLPAVASFKQPVSPAAASATNNGRVGSLIAAAATSILLFLTVAVNVDAASVQAPSD